MIKGMSNIDVRMLNRKNILNVLYRYGTMTKQDIASILEISPPTVSILVNDLSKKGLVAAQGALESSGGRRPALIAMVDDSRYAIGVDISENHVRYILITLSAKQVSAKKIDLTFEDTQNYWMNVSKQMSEFIGDAQIDTALILGVGISLPDKIHSEIETKSDELAKIFGFDVEIGNDVKMAALTQVWSRIKPAPAVYVSLDKEVGGAIIAGVPDIFYGAEQAGQFGHMTVINDGNQCGCGQKGCFDAHCSMKQLEKESGLDVASFMDQVKAADQKAASIWDHYLAHLAIAINNLHVIFRSIIIIGGEMSKYIKEYKSELKEKLEKRNPFQTSVDYLRISDYGENDAAFGAALSRVSKFLQ
jgi:predicted NBD/HSP70 family sugar kinase